MVALYRFLFLLEGDSNGDGDDDGDDEQDSHRFFCSTEVWQGEEEGRVDVGELVQSLMLLRTMSLLLLLLPTDEMERL